MKYLPLLFLLTSCSPAPADPATLYEVKLESGVRCVVAREGDAVALDCDWRIGT
jgi:hypothetical protein